MPTIGLGFAFEYYVSGDWETLQLMGWSIVGGALALWLFDRMCMTLNRVEHASFVDAIVVGLGQVIALSPGAAAAGVTLARLLGYERRDAMRLYFLLLILVSAAVIVRDACTLFEVENGSVSNTDMLCGLAAFFAALIGVSILMA